jgi:biopolymer transport protein TolR
MAYNPAHRRKPISQINVVLYIDVMLVLLIIFMVTAPLLKQGVEVRLPTAPSEPLPTDAEQPEPVIVSVDREGLFYINLGDEETQVASEALGEAVSSILTQDPRRPVYVKGDQRVAYQNVVTVMVELQKAGVDDVGLLTEPPATPPDEN